MTSNHPSWEEIVDAVERSTGALRDHLAGCPTCSKRAAEAARLIGLFREANLEEVPRSIVDEAHKKVVETLRTDSVVASDPAGAFLRRFIDGVGDGLQALWATLVADSHQANLAFRGSTYTAPRMLLYECPQFTISVSLNVGSEPDTIDVLGQVSPRATIDLGGGVVGLKVNDDVHETTLSEFGEFAFYSVTEATLEIEVGVGDALVRLAPISNLPDR